MPERGSTLVGWDIGGAHVKACLLRDGEVLDVAQWACPLWQGMDRLDAVLQSAWQRWSAMAHARHAVTMTGEMVDLFAHREDGVVALARRLAQHLHLQRGPRHRRREHAQHQRLASVDVLQLGHVRVADLAEHHALD